MATIQKELGNRIRLLRLNKEQTQETMAKALGLTPGAYAKVERGEVDPSITRLHEIAKILEVDLLQLLRDGTGAVSNGVGRAEMDLLYSHLQTFSLDLKQIKADLSAIKKTLPKKK